MTERTVNIEALLEYLKDCRDGAHWEMRIDKNELWAIVTQLRAFRTLPKHSGSCSNQNPLDPVGAWRGVDKCGCRT